MNFSNHPASSGIATTAVELNRFLSGLFEGRLISKQSLALMLPENKGEYGMGIEKVRFRNPIGYIYGGRIENYFHYKSDHTFVYDDEGTILEFMPDEQRLLLKAGDLVFEFKKI